MKNNKVKSVTYQIGVDVIGQPIYVIHYLVKELINNKIQQSKKARTDS